MIIEYQQIEKFPDCVRHGKETRLFSRTEDSPRRKNPGFSPVRRVCPAFDLLNINKCRGIPL
ncbi:Uncharacterized protein dnm_096220 [Desulfonema magnum]|uniref:Uncharacterized protein n=1 Tax=Desulfonema magnum TaxID=45655 RepID=A0A975BYW3_9BACT|nr:Uncharacterized protein dnm_096220 [Desulfonema magnum]